MRRANAHSATGSAKQSISRALRQLVDFFVISRARPAGDALRVWTILLNGINVICTVQSGLRKYFAGAVGQIRGIESRVSSHRGALRNVTNAARDAVDVKARFDETRGRGRRSRVVLTPRRWRQVCGSHSAGEGGKQA